MHRTTCIIVLLNGKMRYDGDAGDAAAEKLTAIGVLHYTNYWY